MPAAHLRAPPIDGQRSEFHYGCTGKVPQTQRQAIGVKRRRADYRHGMHKVHVYRCGFCGWYHTSHRELGSTSRGRLVKLELAAD